MSDWLAKLPIELQLEIAEYLNPVALRNLRLTSKENLSKFKDVKGTKFMTRDIIEILDSVELFKISKSKKKIPSLNSNQKEELFNFVKPLEKVVLQITKEYDLNGDIFDMNETIVIPIFEGIYGQVKIITEAISEYITFIVDVIEEQEFDDYETQKLVETINTYYPELINLEELNEENHIKGICIFIIYKLLRKIKTGVINFSALPPNVLILSLL